jgi:type IV secretory pathway TraG/TraD family ATPase VirD4
VRSTGATMILAYQASSQVRNMRDQRVDKDAAQTTVDINCEMRVYYGTTLLDTAEQISKASGTTRVLTPMSESAEVGAYGGERWSGKRSFREEEAALVSTNTVQALPERVAILARPNAASAMLWTCWMPSRGSSAYDAAIKEWEQAHQVANAPAAPKTIKLKVPERPAPKGSAIKEKAPGDETPGPDA